MIWITRFPSEPYSDPFGASGTASPPASVFAVHSQCYRPKLVAGEGIEPSRSYVFDHMILSHARLPEITPSRENQA